jgi:hypothetical protein
MRIQKYSYQLFIFILGIVSLSHCKKTVTTIDSFTGFGRIYPIYGNQNITGAIKSPDGGYLIWGNANAGTNGKPDGFLLRLDKDYNQLWYKTYGGVGLDYFESAIFDAQGNILAAGTSTSFGASLDTISVIPCPCIYAVYVNGNGELLWQKTYTGNPGATHWYDASNKVLLLPDQNFALTGLSANYPVHIGAYSAIMNNAFIQCINKQGDTLWQGNFNYNDTIGLPSYPFCRAANAILSPDGNIEMLVVQDSGKNDFLMSLIKVAPNSTGGYNKFISRIPIQGKYYYGAWRSKGIGSGVYTSPYFPMQLVNESSENYLIATESEMIFCNPGGTVLKRIVISETSTINDLLYSNGYAWFTTNHNLIKTDLNGTIIWNNTDYDKLEIEKVKGIFMEKDGTISVFCSYTNAVREKDIALLRLNENGQLILQ